MKNLSIYVLTYNLPEQFELWCQSFLRAHEETFSQCEKYVINNSDDPLVEEEYEYLFNKYSFEELRMHQNVGINDGRYIAARHFHDHENKYMIFFEDDMLLCSPESGLCSSGFPRYQEDLFGKSIRIMEKEGIDYLKLNFTEVFGQNHNNHAWEVIKALQGQGGEKVFSESEIKNIVSFERKTKIKYTGSEEGLAYAVGNYFYCNWPILFTKNANRIFFLKEFDLKYETLWMIMSYLLNDFEILKSGCLFLSPINHYRKFSYGVGNRKENVLGV